MTRFLIYNALLCKWTWWADYVNHLLLTADLQCVVDHLHYNAFQKVLHFLVLHFQRPHLNYYHGCFENRLDEFLNKQYCYTTTKQNWK